MNNKVLKIGNAIETMCNKKHIEIKFVILEFMEDGITGHINGNFHSLFERKNENLGFLKLRKENGVWKIIEPTNRSYRRVKDEHIPENWKGSLKLIDGRGPCITPRTNC